MSEVMGLTRSYDLWTTLEEIFSDKSKTRELQLLEELQLLRKGDSSVGARARNFKRICESCVR